MATARESNQSSFWQRIQGKLVLLLLVLLVPILMIQAYLYHDRFVHERSRELQANLEMARSLAKAFEMFVEDILHLEGAVGIALTPAHPISREEQDRILEKEQADHPAILHIGLVDPKGIIVAGSARNTIGLDLNDRAHIQKILAGADWAISDLILAKSTFEPAFTIARAVRDERGALTGIVIAVIFPEQLERILAVGRSTGGGHALVDSRGMLVYRYPAIKTTWEERNWIRDFPEFGDALDGKEVAKRVYAPFENKTRLVAFTPVPSIGWAASAGRTEDVAMSAFNSELQFHILLFSTVFLAAFGAALLFARPISASIQKLKSNAIALGRGEILESASASGPTEIRELAESFDTMSEELRRREFALLMSEEDLKRAQAVSKVGSWRLDIRGNNLTWSDETHRIFGFPKGIDLSYETFLSAVHPDDREAVDRKWSAALKGEPYMIEHRIIVGGTVKCVREQAELEFDSEGALLGGFGTVQDITERKEAEKKLKDAHEFSRAILDTVDALILVVDRNGRIVQFNAACEQLTGWRVDEVIGRCPLDFLVPEEQRAGALEQLKELTSGMFPNLYENDWVLRDGSRRWITWANSVLLDAEGSVEYIIGTGIDISERKKAEQALFETHQRLQALMNALPVGVSFSDDSTCRSISGNPAVLAQFEVGSRDNLSASAPGARSPGRKVRFFKDGREINDPELPLQRAVAEGREIPPVELKCLLPSGREWYLEASGSPILNIEGNIIGGVAVSVDITHRKQMEEELRKSRDELELRVQERTVELERSNQALQDFAAIASHDMREPLRKVISFGNMLRRKYRDSLGDTGNDYLNRMIDATQRMHNLLTSLLEFSRVTMSPEPFKEVDLYDIVHEVLSDLEVRIQTSGGEVHVGKLPTIEADPTQMRQLFQNLIGNALKFQKIGERPVVTVHCMPSSDSFYQITVEDNGIGFDEQFDERIFAPFQRLCGRSEYEGTGIGLAICRKIVERHGGSITARSAPGAGSTFIIRLPSTLRGEHQSSLS